MLPARVHAQGRWLGLTIRTQPSGVLINNISDTCHPTLALNRRDVTLGRWLIHLPFTTSRSRVADFFQNLPLPLATRDAFYERFRARPPKQAKKAL